MMMLVDTGEEGHMARKRDRAGDGLRIETVEALPGQPLKKGMAAGECAVRTHAVHQGHDDLIFHFTPPNILPASAHKGDAGKRKYHLVRFLLVPLSKTQMLSYSGRAKRGWSMGLFTETGVMTRMLTPLA